MALQDGLAEDIKNYEENICKYGVFIIITERTA